MANLFDAYFAFNTTGSVNTRDSFSAFIDKDGNIIDQSNLEYGVYNKSISISYNRLFYIKKHKVGLGDVVDYITEKTKIKDLIIYLTKGNCGCEKRKELFNKWFTFNWYSLKTRELYIQDVDVINHIKKAKKNKLKLPSLEDKLKMIQKTFSPKIDNSEIKTKNPGQVDNKPKPIEPGKIKGCGCKNKNKKIA